MAEAAQMELQSPDGLKVYVANGNSNTVSVIDTTNNTVYDTINLGNGPAALGKFIAIF